MANTTDAKIIAYVADISDIKSKLKELENINTKLSGKIGQDLSKGIKQVGKSINQVSTTETKEGLDSLANTSVKTTDKFKALDGTMIQMTKTTKVNAKGVSKTTTAFKEMDKNTVSLGTNIVRLAKRAALTIPLWFALRTAISGTFRVISDGVKNIGEFDKVLQKARRNLQGSSREIESNFQRLKKEVLSLSLQTGIAVEDITTAFQRFATTGQDFETSLAGATASVKLAVAEFGDTVDVADALARSYKILADNVDDNISKQDQLIKTASLIDELWKTNSFDINELGRSLQRFASTADIFNISMDDSIKLLATLSSGTLIAQRGGRLLGSSMLKLVSNLDEVAKTLGVKFNPEMDDAVSVLFKTVDALVEVQKQGKLKGLAETSQTLRELFNLRGQIPIASLVSLRDLLKENFALTGDIDKFNQSFRDVTETVGVLQERFTNLNKEIGKSFVTGLVGGDNFKDSLKEIVAVQESNVKSFNVFGELVRRASIQGFGSGLGLFFVDLQDQIKKSSKEVELLNKEIVEGLSGELTGIDLRNLILDLSKIEDLEPFGGERVLTALSSELFKISSRLKDQISVALSEGLSKEQLQKLSKDLETVDFRFLGFEEDQFDLIVDGVEKALKEVDSLINKEVKKDRRIPLGVDISVKDLNKVNEALINTNIEQLKGEGALASSLLRRRTELEKMLGITQDGVTLIERQLQKERELTKEKRLQSELGNESIKLFRIAQEQGTATARKIGDVLAGEADFSTFVRKGGKELEIFKKEFADIFEQQQAKAFFKGDITPGIKGLRGGAGINIQEQALRGLGTRTRALGERDRLLRRQFGPTAQARDTQIIQNQVQAPVSIKVELDISKLNEVKTQFIDEVSKELPKIGTKINTALKNALVGKQAQNL